jgi:hypothetical protein
MRKLIMNGMQIAADRWRPPVPSICAWKSAIRRVRVPSKGKLASLVDAPLRLPLPRRPSVAQRSATAVVVARTRAHRVLAGRTFQCRLGWHFMEPAATAVDICSDH